jgi:peptidyl-prolyl cis-trans isomerase SurA
VATDSIPEPQVVATSGIATDTLETINTSALAYVDTLESKHETDSIVPFERFKIDGVAAVVGERVILESDIRQMYLQLESQGIPTDSITDCELAERLMKNKLYAHQAVQDSIVVEEAQINGQVQQRIDYLTNELGSMDKLLEYYRLDSETELRAQLHDIVKEQELTQRMQAKVIEEIEITPEETREFFDAIPEGKLPEFGDEVEIAQIVIEPEVPEEEVQRVIDRLNEFRDEILAGESSFATKAVLYSDDPGSSVQGGKITMTRDDPFVREFKQAAFSMQEGQISKPFKTEFGYHILMVEEIRGQKVIVRHILLVPERTPETIAEAKAKADSIRQVIVDGKMDFAEAARKFSDQEETREDGGRLRNPLTGGTRQELAKVDPDIYNQVVDLKEGEISPVLRDSDRTGNIFFKIMTVNERYPAHIANYAQDFEKIKELALKEKKLDAIAEWQNETIKDTYIKINGKYRECDFLANWRKE